MSAGLAVSADPLPGRRPTAEAGVAASGRRAVFLDRDGVLNDLVRDPASGALESPLQLSDVRLVAGAAAAARQLAQAGFVLVCVSNQPAAAKGTVSVEQLLAIHARVRRSAGGGGGSLWRLRACACTIREGVVPGLARACECRKPAPGMLLDAAAALGLDLAVFVDGGRHRRRCPSGAGRGVPDPADRASGQRPQAWERTRARSDRRESGWRSLGAAPDAVRNIRMKRISLWC